MGKSNRGKSEEAIRKYGDPAFDASSGMAKRAGDIYYGGPSSPTAAPKGARDRRPPTIAPSTEHPSSGGIEGGNHQQIFQDMFPGGSLSSDQLIAKKDELAAAGIEVLTNAAGKSGKVRLPDGSVIDVIEGVMSGKNIRQWNLATGPGGSSIDGGAPGGGGGVAGGAIRDYGEILNRYREFAGSREKAFSGVLDRYRQFADTGGYSPGDLGAIRSRALSPVRAAYSDVNRDIDRSRSLTGDYAPGYAATKAKVGREQAYTTADATTNVESAIAQMVQQGKLAGMGGMGQTMGQIQGGQIAGLGGQAGMYGTTPGMASMFGRQALGAQSLQNQMGLGMMGARNQSLQQPGMFDTIMGGAGRIGGAILPWLSAKESKENIKPVKKGILARLKKLPISTWNYKGDGRVHVGPMAEDFFEQFGGDRKTISPIDVAGVLLGSVKELAENAST